MEILSRLPILLQEAGTLQTETDLQTEVCSADLFAALLPTEGQAENKGEEPDRALPEEAVAMPDADCSFVNPAGFAGLVLFQPVRAELRSPPEAENSATEVGNPQPPPDLTRNNSVKFARSDPPPIRGKAAENALPIAAGAESVDNSAKSPPKSDGTPVATPPTEMLSIVKELEITEPAESDRPQEAAFKLVRNGDFFIPEAALKVTSEQSALEPSAHAQEIEAPQSLGPQEAVRTLVHTIREQVILLRKMDETEMTVVVPAREGSDLHLQLAQKDGVIEVSAACESDCFAALHAHWGELKQTLSEQGIELQELELSNDLSDDSGGGEDFPEERDALNRPGFETWEGFIPATVQFETKTEPEVKGWQSWA